VSRYLLLDSGPLGLVTQPRPSPEVVAMNHWLIDCLSSGDAVLVPPSFTTNCDAILDAFVQSEPTRYLALTDEALRLAAELWAKARQQGRPTSSELDLDVDVILAPQTLLLGADAEALSSPPIPAIFASL